MWKYFSNFSKANNLGLFFLILTPIAFITGSFTANLFTILLIIFLTGVTYYIVYIMRIAFDELNDERPDK